MAMRRERYTQALALIESIEPKISKQTNVPKLLPHQYMALKGELLIRNERFEEARRCLKSVLEKIQSEESGRAKYLRIYIQFWLAELRGDMAKSSYYSRASLGLEKYASGMIEVPIRDSDLDEPLFDPEIVKEASSVNQSVDEFIRQQVVK